MNSENIGIFERGKWKDTFDGANASCNAIKDSTPLDRLEDFENLKLGILNSSKPGIRKRTAERPSKP